MSIQHNCRVKRYPDGSADLVISASAFGGAEVTREPQRFDGDGPAPEPFAGLPPRLAACRRLAAQELAYELLERAAIQDDGPDDAAVQARQRANRERSQRRARVAVHDLGLCNDWAFFVTLTLDPRRIDRYDPVEVLRHLNHWLDNHVRRDGLAYVLVPEHHRDGAIHFHGFFNDALPAVDSGHKDKGGHCVYNLPSWGWGFSTAIRLYGDRRAAVGYCCKYVAKQREKIGGRWYYSGGKLRRPDVTWTDADYEQLDRPAAGPPELLPDGVQRYPRSYPEGVEPFCVDGLPWSKFVRVRVENYVENCLEQFALQESCKETKGGEEL